MVDGPAHERRPSDRGGTERSASRTAARGRPVRIALTLIVIGGLTLTAACTAGAPDSGAPVTEAPAVPPAAAPPPGPPSQVPPPAPPPAAPAVLKLNASGPAVLALQQRLSDLGYWLGDADGTYGQLTRQAVMAFQKAEGLTRDGVAGPQTQQRLPDASRPTAQNPSGNHLEVDLGRQLLLVVSDGGVRWAFNTSTGNGEAYDRPSGGSGVARTPRGTFRMQREINGLRRAELGTLYRPKYFNGGIAVHGSGSIPAHPASHGCVRLTNTAMDLLWSSGVAEIGTPVLVH